MRKAANMNSFDKWRGNPPTSGYGRDIQSWHSETERLRKCWDEAQADLLVQVERLKEQLATQTAKNYEICELYLRCGNASRCKHYKDAPRA